MNKTGIQYLDFTWNPVTGCTKGCPECWAREVSQKRLAPAMKKKMIATHQSLPERLASEKMVEAYRTFAPTLHPERLDQPARRKKPSVIGVCFMGDLFDPGLDEVERFRVMSAADRAPQHTYVFLTKQPRVMAEWMKPYIKLNHRDWYLGFSARTQAEFDAGWPHMAKLAAAGWKVWVSLEPMQEAIALPPVLEWCPGCGMKVLVGPTAEGICEHCRCATVTLSTVITGAQSPTGPWSDDWPRAIRDQCAAAGVPFMHKQGLDSRGKVVKLPMLDGRQHTELAWRLS